MIRAIYITMIAEAMPSWCLRPEILSDMNLQNGDMLEAFCSLSTSEVTHWSSSIRRGYNFNGLAEVSGRLNMIR